MDTSIVGAIHDIEDPRRVGIAKTFLERIKKGNYEAFISRLLIEGISRAPKEIREGLFKIVEELDVPVLEETRESLELAEVFLREGIIPERFRDDARHIAIAVFYELDLVVSWNYEHMVNIRVKNMVNSVCLRLGFRLLDMVSPEEVIEYGEMES